MLLKPRLYYRYFWAYRLLVPEWLHLSCRLKPKISKRVKVVDDYTDTMGHAGAILIDAKTHLMFGATDHQR